jgi:protease IV
LLHADLSLIGKATAELGAYKIQLIGQIYMWSFLKGVWGFLVGLKEVIVTVLVIGLLVLVLRSLFAGDGAPSVPDDAALALNLDGYVVEQRTEVNPLATLTDPMAATLPAQTLLRDVVEAIDSAAKDTRIKALTLELDYFAGAGPATLETISEALGRFKASGKAIYAHGQYYSDASYYLASRATSISLDPMGGVMLTGYGSYNLYMKDAIDKLKVNVNIFRVGKYKSAVEPYARNDMSPEAREESQALFDVLWDKYKSDVELGRGKGIKIQSYIDSMAQAVPALKGDISRYAFETKLVDKLQSREQYIADMARLVGADEDDDGLPSYRQVSMDAYLVASRTLVNKPGDKIAVVYAAGEIIDGDHGPGVAGGDTVARLLRKAAQDDSVKAIVLRIDSPGGSVTASEIIRRAVTDARAAQKPVIASMGTLAASGGYWIATGADEIYAQPTTITGSIGIFGMIPTFEKTAALVGVKSDGVGTTTLSASGDLAQGFTEPVRALIQATVNHGYDQFIDRVAKARHLTPERVNDIAQGRVWAGATAQQLKLVDRFGDLDAALAAAAARAKLTVWHADYMEEPESIQMKLLRYMTGAGGNKTRVKSPPQGMALASMTDQLSRAALLLTGQSLRDRNNLYAYCASCSAIAPPNLSKTRVQLAQQLLKNLPE